MLNDVQRQSSIGARIQARQRQLTNRLGQRIEPILNKVEPIHSARLTSRLPSQDASVSVVIPTRNAGTPFYELLQMIQAQQGFRHIELIVVDSGSEDGTPALARACGARVIEMAADRFSHATARNWGAAAATGDYLFFTVQDAQLPDRDWLCTLLNRMVANRAIAASCREQVPPNVDLFYRVLMWRHDRFMAGPHSAGRVMKRPRFPSYIALRANAQLSNVACLIERETFQQHQFRTPFAEDLDLGLRLIRSGKRMVYVRAQQIIHGHSRAPLYYLKRGFVDQLQLAQLFPHAQLVTARRPAELCAQLIAAHNMLAAVADQIPKQIETPISAAALAQALQRLVDGSAADCSGTIRESPAADTMPYLQRLTALQRVCPQPRQQIGVGDLRPTIAAWIRSICDFLASTNETIDAHHLLQLAACLPKVHALVSGAHLAASYHRYGVDGLAGLEPIYASLAREV